MARRNDIAGLAALAALGYGLYNSAKDKSSAKASETKTSAKASDDSEPYLTSPVSAASIEPAPTVSAPAAPVRAKAAADREESRPAPAAPTRATPKPNPANSGKDMRGTGEAAALARNYKPRYNPTKAEQEMALAEAYARSPQGRAERKAQIESQAIEGVYPEQNLIGGPGLKTLHSAAKALAGTGKVAASGSRALATKGPEDLIFLGKSGARPIGEAERVGYETGKRLGYQEGRAVGRAEGPPQLGAPPRQLTGPRKQPELTEADWTGGAIGYKKGGSVRKSAAPKKTASKGAAVASQKTPSVKGWGQARGARKAKIY